jgi:hypothetical protein
LKGKAVNQIAPDTVDAQSFASNLVLLTDLMPSMPEPARRRAAWAVAKSHLSLADAVKVEGFSLDGDAASPAPNVLNVLKAKVAELEASIAASGAAIAAFKRSTK